MPSKSKNPKGRTSEKSRKSQAKTKEVLRTGGTKSRKQRKQRSESKVGQKTSMGRPNAIKGFKDTTSRVVHQAASILEEEIAAGIVAAKQVEERFINVREVRSKDPEEVMYRFRRDAHDVLDIFLDIVHASTKSMGGIAQNVITHRSIRRQPKSEQMAPERVSTLTMPQSIKAGESAEVPMSVANDSDSPTEKFNFHCSDLTNASGARISAQQITFTPPSLMIGPTKTEKVMVTVKVPKRTPAGVYSGLIQATKLSQLRAVLIVRVE